TRELPLWHFWLTLGIPLAALLGNSLIITSTACDQHPHTPRYFFLLNLSLLDLGCISTLPPDPAFLFLGCFVFIVGSYVQIFRAVLSIPSEQGRHKAFSTYLPHLPMLSLF
ncbi:olfactory receptor 14I1-like, partial [Ara ararauna]